MQCPSCSKEFHPQPDMQHGYYLADQSEDDARGFGITVQLCPSCSKIVVAFREGEIYSYSGGTRTYVSPYHLTSEEIIYPKVSSRPLADEVPDTYREEYEEAFLTNGMSSKASAALSRRLLQSILQTELGIKKRNLSDEIDEFISTAGAPSYLNDAIDAIRNIGNFGAHPIKNTNTGEIVDVEEGEAEWLLEVIEFLLDFVFVQPRRLEARKQELNKKLEAMGKPKLKEPNQDPDDD